MLLMDGGTGSELQRRGVDVLKDATDNLKAWSATSNIDNADVVQQVHQDYLRVGADIIISNNFWTTPSAMERIGMRDRWQDYAKAAADNAVRARDAGNQDAYVAGGIAAPTLYFRIGQQEPDVDLLGAEGFRAEYVPHAQILADAGADVILAEYVGYIADCVAAVDASAEVGLPVFLGIRHLHQDGKMQFGEDIRDLAAALRGHPVDAVLIMCSNPEAISGRAAGPGRLLRRARGSLPQYRLQPDWPPGQPSAAHQPAPQRRAGHPADSLLPALGPGRPRCRMEGHGRADHRWVLRDRARAHHGHAHRGEGRCRLMSDDFGKHLRAIAESADASLRDTHEAREQALTLSRRIVRSSANSIRAAHRGELDEAHRLVGEASELASRLGPFRESHPSVYYGGYVEDALKEYTEASAVLAITEGSPLKGPDELGVGAAPYLNGLAEVVGELRRLILDGLRRGDFSRCEELLGTMDDIYTVLVAVDYPDAVTRGLRRSTDASRGILERTRGDLTLALRQDRLEARLAEFEERIGPDS